MSVEAAVPKVFCLFSSLWYAFGSGGIDATLSDIVSLIKGAPGVQRRLVAH